MDRLSNDLMILEVLVYLHIKLPLPHENPGKLPKCQTSPEYLCDNETVECECILYHLLTNTGARQAPLHKKPIHTNYTNTQTVTKFLSEFI